METRQSSFKQSEISPGQLSGSDWFYLLLELHDRRNVPRFNAAVSEPSEDEVQLALAILKTPMLRQLLKQVKKQLTREGESQRSSEHDVESNIPIVRDNTTSNINRNGSRLGSWVKRRLLSLTATIRKRLDLNKYRDKTYDPDLHVRGYNNATNTVVVVAALMATLSFGALLQPPGGLSDSGSAKLASTVAFKTFFISNGLALFVALLSILILTSLVPRSQYEARILYEYGKLLVWVATIFTVIAFSTAAYIVCGHANRVLAWIVFVAAGATIFVLFAVVLSVTVERRLKRSRSRKAALQRSQPIQAIQFGR